MTAQRCCVFCGKPETDALTIRGWSPVHAACAAKHNVAVWVNA